MTSQLLDRAKRAYRESFGAAPTCAASAPGRVNLIGEHTDYQDGFVFPLALEMRTVIVGSLSGTKTCRVMSAGFGETTFEANRDKLSPTSGWENYVKGVVAVLLEKGYKVPGFNAVIASNVPTGGGLSSSAALEVATATFIESLTNHKIDQVQKALICQKAEHDFPKMPCGIMDQFISSCGVEKMALKIDCRTQSFEPCPIPSSVSIVVCNSNVKHELTGSEYPDRVKQCKQAVKTLNQKSAKSGTHLRDFSLDDLELCRPFLDGTSYRRGKHVIAENARCVAAAEALRRGKLEKCGKLMNASHFSLSSDFEVSTPELDFLVDHAIRQAGVYGSRMTGGGFGGCTVSLVKSEHADALMEELDRAYFQKFGVHTTSFVTSPGQGATIHYSGARL